MLVRSPKKAWPRRRRLVIHSLRSSAEKTALVREKLRQEYTDKLVHTPSRERLGVLEGSQFN